MQSFVLHPLVSNSPPPTPLLRLACVCALLICTDCGCIVCKMNTLLIKHGSCSCLCLCSCLPASPALACLATPPLWSARFPITPTLMVSACLTEGAADNPTQIRIQWHVIIAVQRGVCVMLGRAKHLVSVEANFVQAAATATSFFSRFFVAYALTDVLQIVLVFDLSMPARKSVCGNFG